MTWPDQLVVNGWSDWRRLAATLPPANLRAVSRANLRGAPVGDYRLARHAVRRAEAVHALLDHLVGSRAAVVVTLVGLMIGGTGGWGLATQRWSMASCCLVVGWSLAFLPAILHKLSLRARVSARENRLLLDHR